MKRRKDCVLDCASIRKLRREMFDLIEETRKTGQETGFIAYQDPFTCKTKVLELCRGNSCGIQFKNQAWGNFTFHTHPSSLLRPSKTDLLTDAKRGRLGCIGVPGDPTRPNFHREAWDAGPMVRCWKLPQSITEQPEKIIFEAWKAHMQHRTAKWKASEKVIAKAEYVFNSIVNGDYKPFCEVSRV